MIIDFYGQGGGSGSGVTPEEVQEQIQSALTEYTPTSGFSTINGSAITEGEAIVIDEPDLTNYWDSAQTESAISAATSGKADKPLRETYPLAVSTLRINAGNYDLVLNGDYGQNIGNIWAPLNNGQAGQILVARGGQISPVWSAVTFISSADVQSQIDTKAADYTPTTGFSTINGSAITNGGNIVIEGGGDLSNYWDSAQTQAHIDSAYTSATTHIEDVERVAATALNSLNTKIIAISAATSGKADAVSVSANTDAYVFPTWNEEGVITGKKDEVKYGQIAINGTLKRQLIGNNDTAINIYAPENEGVIGQIPVLRNYTYRAEWATPISINESSITAGGNIYAPQSAGTAGDILVSTGGVPVWSAITFISSADVKDQVDSVYTSAATYIADVERVASAALNELNTEVSALSAVSADFVTSAQVETQITNKNYTTSAATATQIATATANMVTSTTVTTIWKGTQAQYDQISPKDAYTLYIIVSA